MDAGILKFQQLSVALILTLRASRRGQARVQRPEARSRTRRRVLARLVRKVQSKSHLNLIVIPLGCGVDLGSKSASFVL